MVDDEGEHPLFWEHFLRRYGHAVYVAHLLEKNLATLLWFLEARKRNVIRRPRPHELDEMIDEIDSNTIGELLKRITEYQLDADTILLFRAANANRITLVHHFTTNFPDETADDSDFNEAVRQVHALAEPILEAQSKADGLVRCEIERMRAEIGNRSARI